MIVLPLSRTRIQTGEVVAASATWPLVGTAVGAVVVVVAAGVAVGAFACSAAEGVVAAGSSSRLRRKLSTASTISTAMTAPMISHLGIDRLGSAGWNTSGWIDCGRVPPISILSWSAMAARSSPTTVA